MADIVVHQHDKLCDLDYAQVLAIKILTFSIRFGEFTAIDLSRMKPVTSSGIWLLYIIEYPHLRQDMNQSAFRRLF